MKISHKFFEKTNSCENYTLTYIICFKLFPICRFPNLYKPRVLIRREIPTLQDVMDDAMKRRFGPDSESRHRREAEEASSKLTKEELEESKRKSRVMTQLLDSIFNNYDMYIRPGFQDC